MKLKFPNDWGILKIKNLNSNGEEIVQTGPFGSQLHSSDYVKEGIPFILIRNFKNNKIDTSGMPFISIKDAERLKKYRLKKGDIIFSRVGRIGDTIYTEQFMEGWTISGQLLRIRPKDKRINNRFLNYVLKSNFVQKQINAACVGSTRKSLNSSILEQLKFPFPSIEEQQKIVSILSNIDEIIIHTQKIIEKLQECKKGLMQRLFTEGIGHTEFKETKLGKIPKKWEIVKLKEVAKVESGGNAPQGSEYFQEGTFPFIRVKHFDGEKLYVDEWDLINKKAIDEYNLKLFPRESIIFPKSGAAINLEKRAFIPKDSYVVGHLCIVIPNEKLINKYFLFYFLKRKKMKTLSAGTSLPYLNLNFIKNFRILLPDRIEQDKIGEVLNCLDNKIENEQKYQKILKEVKKGLMQVLLTGKKRVNL